VQVGAVMVNGPAARAGARVGDGDHRLQREPVRTSRTTSQLSVRCVVREMALMRSSGERSVYVAVRNPR